MYMYNFAKGSCHFNTAGPLTWKSPFSTVDLN